MIWVVALIDSSPVGIGGVRFTRDGEGPAPVEPDPTGHGSRLAALLAEYAPTHELLSVQVFDRSGVASVAAVTAGIRWAVSAGAHLIHLSLGLPENRPMLADAIASALSAGCLVIAAAPARGATVYPAAYDGVLIGTGDARCAPSEISWLGANRYGGCVDYESANAGAGRGASVGAAFVTASVLSLTSPGMAAAEVMQILRAHSRYDGPERRTIGDIPECNP